MEKVKSLNNRFKRVSSANGFIKRESEKREKIKRRQEVERRNAVNSKANSKKNIYSLLIYLLCPKWRVF